MATQERRWNTPTPASDRQDSPLASDLAPLRVALRLLFRSDDADRLAALALGARDRGRALRPVVQAAGLRYTLARWRDRLRRRRAGTRDAPPLGPHTGLPARAALALALHLSLDLDGVELSKTLHLDLNDVGLVLDRARRAVHPDLPPACPEFAALAGRYRDRALDPVDRVALFGHAQACERCRAALEGRQQVDEGLIAAIAACQAALPSVQPRPSLAERWLASPTVFPLGIVALVVALIAVGIGSWIDLGTRGRAPVPLATAAPPAVDGWLLIRGESGSLDALNLATGERRTLVTPPPGSAWPEYLLSPDSRLIAELSEGPPAIRIAIYRLDGSVVRTWSWEQQRLATLSGWLNGSTLLIVEWPEPAPVDDWSDEQNDARIVRENYAKEMRESELLALDVQTGQVRTLARGGIALAFPSPDGTMIAMIEPQDLSSPGWTLVLRPLGPEGLGRPVATIERRVWGYPVWSPDSSRLYFSRIADPEIPLAPEPVDPRSSALGPRQVDLVALDRAGWLVTVAGGSPGEWLTLVGVSPDGRTIVYDAVRQDSSGMLTRSAWRAGIDGGNRQEIATMPIEQAVQIAWLGNGALLLVEPTSPSFSSQRTAERDDFPWVTLTLVGMDGSRQPLMAVAGAFFGYGGLVPWLDPGALPEPVPEAVRGEVRIPSPAPSLPPWLRLGAGSSAGVGGDRVMLLDEATGQGTVVWSRSSAGSRGIRPSAADISWVPGQPALVGVLRPTHDTPVRAPNGIFFAVDSSQSSTSYAVRLFDPAGIASDPHRRYARPLVSPNGLAVAFFVVDDEAGTVELWISTAGGRTERVPIESYWPAGSPLGQARPAALWLDRQTLLYASPEDWQRGLPRRVTFWRVTIGADGRVASEPVFAIDTRGRETGILLAELALSPDGTRLAYRLRHFTRPDPASGAFDTLVVVPVADASQRLEIARGEPGDGLAWSPDSRWLAAGLRGRVELISADGRARKAISPDDTTAAYPLWVGPRTVWYQQTTGDEGRIMAVEIR